MNIKGFLKTGAVLITSVLILTGCGNSSLAPEKKTSAVQSTTPKPEISSAEMTLLTIDETLDSLDQSLDGLDFK